MKKLLTPIYADSEDKISYDIPVKWEMSAVLNVQARSLKEAIQIVNRQEYDIPEGEYVADTYEIDYGSLEE